MPVVSGEGDGGEFGVADLDAFGVFGRFVVGLDGEPGFGGGGGDELDDGAYGGEGPASQLRVMKLNMRCSILFHFEVPGG